MSDAVCYTLTPDEVYRVLWKTRRPLPRLVAQTVLLFMLGLPSLWRALTDSNPPPGSWLLGVALPLLAVVGWVLPAVMFRREARGTAVSVTLRVTADTIAVGDVTQPLCEARFCTAGDLLLWQVGDHDVVAIPSRVLPEDTYTCLYALSKK